MSNKRRNPKEPVWLSWVLTIAAFNLFWPLGIFFLIRILTVGSITSPRKTAHSNRIDGTIDPNRPIDVQAREIRPGGAARPAQSRPVNSVSRRRTAQSAAVKPLGKKWGRGLILSGGIVTGLFAFILATYAVDIAAYGWYSYMAQELVFLTGCLAAGVTLLSCGIAKRRRGNRYRRYMSLLGKQESLSLDTLAKTLRLPYRKVCDDLQDMLDQGYLPAGYVDLLNRRIVFSDSGLQEEAPPPAPEPKPEGNAAILAEIRAINDDIDDAAMSAKIDRIEEITCKILDYQSKHPESADELRSFLNYYLPTTLKILRSYAKLEDQGIEGKNISAAKASIEGMMDKIVDGFETRLDKLFQSEALDITSDVQVLEQMLKKDGLSEDDLLKIEL